MQGQEFIKEINAYIPIKLKLDLDITIDDTLYYEMDGLIVIDGKEGSGKSYDARLIAKYIALRVKTPFSVPNIHFGTDPYISFSESQPKFTINVLDESREALNKKRAMSKSNVKFSNWISENRDKQQFHIIVLPAVHDLDSYISIWRMKLLIHKLIGHIPNKKNMSGYEFKRGYFRVYENSKNLQQVMFNKSKFGYYSYPKYAKYTRKMVFKEVFTPEELKAYKEKKAKFRAEKYKEDDKNEVSRLSKLALKINREGLMTQEEIGETIGLKQSSIGQMIRQLELKKDKNENNT